MTDDTPQEITPRPVGRPRGGSDFARATKSLSPDTKGMLKAMWLSGKFATKMELAEHAGLEYNSLRHLASDENWPTENELRREITDTAVAAVRKLRETTITEILEDSMASYREAGDILNGALKSFKENGALVAINKDTGEQTLSKKRITDLTGLMNAVKIHQQMISDLIGLKELQKMPSDKAPVINAPGAGRVQINLLTSKGRA